MVDGRGPRQGRRHSGSPRGASGPGLGLQPPPRPPRAAGPAPRYSRPQQQPAHPERGAQAAPQPLRLHGCRLAPSSAAPPRRPAALALPRGGRRPRAGLDAACNCSSGTRDRSTSAPPAVKCPSARQRVTAGCAPVAEPRFPPLIPIGRRVAWDVFLPFLISPLSWISRSKFHQPWSKLLAVCWNWAVSCSSPLVTPLLTAHRDPGLLHML